MTAQITDTHESEQRTPAFVGVWTDRLIVVGLTYVAAAALLPQYLEFAVRGQSTGLVVAGALAFVGWHSRSRRTGRIAAYLAAAALFSSWLAIACIASWSTSPFYGAAGVITWFVFIIPGLAMLVAEDRWRRALEAGIVIGATVYGITVAYRLAFAATVTDVVPEGTVGNVGLILGINRNIVSMGIVVAGGCLLGGFGSRLAPIARWALVGLAFLTVAFNGGRSGLIGLGIFALAVAMYHRGLSRRAFRLVIALVAGMAFVVVTQMIGGQAAKASDRLLDFFSDERTVPDQARALDGRRAWNIGLDNPAFGLGYGNYEGSTHPVLAEAESVEVLRMMRTLTAHNTYGLVLAETGFPGVLSFIAMIAMLVFSAARTANTSDVRYVSAGVVTIFVMVAFDGLLGATLYVPMALLLGMIVSADARVKQPAADEPSGRR